MLENRFVAKEVPTGAGLPAFFRWSCCFRADAAATPLRRPGIDGCSRGRSHRRKTGGVHRDGRWRAAWPLQQRGRREGGRRPARLSLPAPPLPAHLRPCAMTIPSLPPSLPLTRSLPLPARHSFVVPCALCENPSSDPLHCPDCRMQSASVRCRNTPKHRIGFFKTRYST